MVMMIENKVPTFDSTICLSSGSISQDNPNFGYTRNVQCVCMSVCVSVVSKHLNSISFTSELIDNIIIAGDKYYKQTKSRLGPAHKHALLNVDEVAPEITFNNKTYRVTTNWLCNGLFPSTETDFQHGVNSLANLIDTMFLDCGTHFIFNGNGYAVAFWMVDTKYYLFNSHSTNECGDYTEFGVARLFMCATSQCLAKLLCKNAVLDGKFRQYEISSVDSVQNPLTTPPTADLLLTDVKLQSRPKVILERNPSLIDYLQKQDSKLQMNAIVLLERLPLSVQLPSSENGRPNMKRKGLTSQLDARENKIQKVGRPTKKRPGPPKESGENTVRKVGRPTKKRPGPSKESGENKARKVGRPGPPKESGENKVQKVGRPSPPKESGENKVQKVGRPSPPKESGENKVQNVGRPGPPKESGENKVRQVGRPTINRPGRPKLSDTLNDGVTVHSTNSKTSTVEDQHRISGGMDTLNELNDDVKPTRKHKEPKPGRHLPPILKTGKLIGEYMGADLPKVKLYTLRNNSLRSETCHKCSKCGAHLFDEEKDRSQWCCGNGRYNVMQLAPLTESFYSEKNFIENARQYNDLFAFCALVIPSGFHHPNGLSFVKIQGRTYHKVYHLRYSDKVQNYNRGSLYIDDGQCRIGRAKDRNLDVSLIRRIERFIKSSNSAMVSLLKMLHNEPSDEAHLVFQATSRKTHGPVLGDRPQSSEVSAIICTDINRQYKKELVIWKHGDRKPTKIYPFHPQIEPFQYPLLYPEGTTGWFIGRLDNSGIKLSQYNYIRCLLLSEERFSKFGRLSETWLVDMYARLDDERLNFIRNAQIGGNVEGGLRIGPMDEVAAVVDRPSESDRRLVQNDIGGDETVQGEGAQIPGKIYLPQTYTGGPRYMRVSYYDAMALVTRLGGPTYFLTFTAFGGWDEIVLSRQNERKSDPSVINRVFQLKFLELLRDIRSGVFFGKLAYIVWVVEFQMRGLPHAHICFRIMGGGPQQSEQVDRVIRATIPSVDEAGGVLRPLVLKHMIHGPCDVTNTKKYPCRDGETGKCSKFFPKPHNDTTFTDDRGFVHYKRDSNNKACVGRRNVTVNDCWVVPYNPALLIKYGCHVNLELASARKVVKYLFKYISKGSPLRRVTIVPGPEAEENDNDEVEEYITARFIGSSDAAWRILGFNVTGREPTVEKLPVHLQGRHNVIFRAGKEKEGLEKSSSKLLLYMNRPKALDMDNLTYQDFFENFIIHTKKPRSKTGEVLEHPDGRHFVTRRQRGGCVARLFFVAPTRGEQYYLRILLMKFPCRSYNDLLLLGGENCSTFQEAARTLGLVNDELEHHEALSEAQEFMTAVRLRKFFVILIANGAPAPYLWEKFNKALCEDFIEQFPNDIEKAMKLGLIEIDRCLRRQNSSLKDAGLPVVLDSTTELGREAIRYTTAIQEEFFLHWEKKLSDDQKDVLTYLKTLVDCPPSNWEKRALFLDGPGGYGKTVILNVIASYFRSMGKIVICVAASGIASLNLTGGTTAHSMFRVPLDLDEGTGYWAMTNLSQRAKLIKEASIIIYDEISMVHKHISELIDRSLKDLMCNNGLFGDKIIIFAGDFRQIPPVIVNARSPSEIINASLVHSRLWENLKIFRLTVPHRTGSEATYAQFLLDIGSNNITPKIFVNENGVKETLVPLTGISYVTNVTDLVQFVFPEPLLENPDECAKRAIICTHSVNVAEINRLISEMIEGQFIKLYSTDSVADDNYKELHIDQDLLHHSEGKNVPDHVISLKVGEICLIMRNLSFDMGLVNGTKVIIVGISRRLVTVRKPGQQERYGIPRISFKFPLFPNSPIEVHRRQFPLQPCYGITVHKSQGQTIDVIGFDLRSDCFTHGQLYVGLSRVRSPKNIRVLVQNSRIDGNTAYTKNIVFQDLLLRD